MNKSICLSSSGLKNVVLSTFTEEDEFILMFEEQQIRMNRIFAEFISPVISHLRKSDPTIQYINFDDLTSTKSDDFNFFSKDILTADIISLLECISSGQSIEIDSNQAFKLRFLSIILGNDELFAKINELFPPEFCKENFDTYINHIQCCYHFSQFRPDFDYSSLLDYISKHFYLINEDTFLKLPLIIQHSIISNPNLQIKSEDSLLDIVNQIIDESSEKVHKDDEKIDKISFLECIEFASLSEEKLREFLENFDFNLITNSLWRKLYQCFFIHFGEKPERIFKRNSEKQTFEYVEDKTDRFNGIIQYLTEKFGGNVDEKGVCKVTSSSYYQKWVPRNAVDFAHRRLIFTSGEINKTNSWLKFDFLNRKVHPTYYSIKTWELAKGNSHLKNWVIEGSNTDRDSDWKILDSRKNETCLDSSFAENTFKIQTNLDDNEYFRYLRIRQNGLNSRKTDQLVVGSMEFFGTII